MMDFKKEPSQLSFSAPILLPPLSQHQSSNIIPNSNNNNTNNNSINNNTNISNSSLYHRPRSISDVLPTNSTSYKNLQQAVVGNSDTSSSSSATTVPSAIANNSSINSLAATITPLSSNNNSSSSNMKTHGNSYNSYSNKVKNFHQIYLRDEELKATSYLHNHKVEKVFQVCISISISVFQIGITPTYYRLYLIFLFPYIMISLL